MSTRRSFLRKSAGFALGASILPMIGCESLGVSPIERGDLDFPFITPRESFFVQYGADGALADWKGLQQIPRNTWRLAIDGLVDKELSLSFADLDANPENIQTVVATMRCILDNNAVPGLIGTATWTGVPLRIFLKRAGIDNSRAKRLRIYGADGFTNNVKLEKMFDTRPTDLIEPLLVFAMNGAPLDAEHGAPVRLLMPGHYGYKSVKWVERIEVTDEDEPFGTYQEVLGYDDDGMIDVNCKTTSVLRGARLTPGKTRLAGFALSGSAGIDAINISINGETPQAARIFTLNELISSASMPAAVTQVIELERYGYPFRGVWTLWEMYWDAPPGEHVIHVEAIDSAGNTQPLIDDNPTDGQNPAIELNVFVEEN